MHSGSHTSNMYIKRRIEDEILAMSRVYPVVTLTGPRQSGKTTVIRHLFPHYPYVNLEAPDVFDRIKADPRRFLRTHHEGVIIDEIQKFPELLSYLQVIVDEQKKMGQFILTGSQQLALNESISQSLVGRTALLNLLPLSIDEAKNQAPLELDELLYRGFYPRVYEVNLSSTKYFRDYVGAYVERDIRQLIHVKDMSLFRKFMKLLAAKTSQVLNYQSLATDVGTTHHTIKSWLSILEALYIVKLLPPYFENFGKRAIKSPKLYFIDVGLACYLLGISEVAQLSRDPLRGALFENMIVMEFIKNNYNQGSDQDLYFFRDNNQLEVDVVFKKGSRLIPIEIKSSETFHHHFIKNLDTFNKICNNNPPQGFVVFGGNDSFEIQDYHVLSFRDLHLMDV